MRCRRAGSKRSELGPPRQGSLSPVKPWDQPEDELAESVESASTIDQDVGTPRPGEDDVIFQSSPEGSP